MPEPDPNPGQPLVEGRDYYMDGPWLVFTREYHLRRGSCCQSGCRHCPWDYKRGNNKGGGGKKSFSGPSKPTRS